MTELLHQDRLRLIAVVMDHPCLRPPRQAAAPQRAAEAKAGRRAGQPAPAAPPAASAAPQA
jgi:hypothetical protein